MRTWEQVSVFITEVEEGRAKGRTRKRENCRLQHAAIEMITFI